jgi:acyl-CoA thioesterase-1
LFIVLLLGALPAFGKTILVFGDSLSAAYGLSERRGWVALLGERLKRERIDYSVVNASISGETTAGGLARIAKALESHKPAVLVLELGANDGLRGLPVPAMKKNLEEMTARAQAAGARVLIIGTRMPPNYGPEYTKAFESAFAEIARQRRAALVPDLTAGIGDRLELFQPDRLHPNEAAQPMLLENVWKVLRSLLKSP